jgi:hypothetical protein
MRAMAFPSETRWLTALAFVLAALASSFWWMASAARTAAPLFGLPPPLVAPSGSTSGRSTTDLNLSPIDYKIVSLMPARHAKAGRTFRALYIFIHFTFSFYFVAIRRKLIFLFVLLIQRGFVVGRIVLVQIEHALLTLLFHLSLLPALSLSQRLVFFFFFCSQCFRSLRLDSVLV